MSWPRTRYARLARWVRNPEVIGDPKCPILFRWTLVDFDAGTSARLPGPVIHRLRAFKVMVHEFPGGADDRDPHDHPRPFWTLVLRGAYEDWVPCTVCDGVGPCPTCDGSRVVLGETMRRGMVRYRPAEHIHMTRALPGGAWTLVVMGPLQREWGFWRRGWFWPFREYEAEFGFGMNCGRENMSRLP